MQWYSFPWIMTFYLNPLCDTVLYQFEIESDFCTNIPKSHNLNCIYTSLRFICFIRVWFLPRIGGLDAFYFPRPNDAKQI